MQTQTMEISLNNELLDGEELLWSGSPLEYGKSMASSSRSLQSKALMYVVLGLILMFLAMIVEIVIGDLPSGRESFILIPGSVLFILGVFLFIFSKTSSFMPKAALYAITTQRIIIFYGGSSLRVMSFDRREIKQVQRVEYRDGSGDLFFSGTPISSDMYSKGTGNIGNQYVLRAIQNVRLAERKLLEGTRQRINE